MIKSRISGNLNVISTRYHPPILALQRHYKDWEPSQSNAEHLDFHGHNICNECGQDHCFRPTFKVKMSIDVIPELVIKAWEDSFN